MRTLAWHLQSVLAKKKLRQLLGATYRNDGTGNPCAGQGIANSWPYTILKDPKVSDNVENFGMADPIGSKGKYLTKLLTY